MTNEHLIGHLKKDVGVLQSPRLEEALRVVDRKFFVPEEFKDEAYEDYPLPIGHGATISQPTTVAFMLEKLDVRDGQKVLDIGSGSGWTTALLAHLVGQGGRVIGLEIVPELVVLGQNNLRTYYSDVLKNIRITPAKAAQVEIRQAKEGVIGLLEEAPFDPVVDFGSAPKAPAKQTQKSTTGFDRILVSAASEKVPEELLRQLKPGGIMVLPVGRDGAIQSLLKVTKQKDGSFESEEYPGFAFVPLQ